MSGPRRVDAVLSEHLRMVRGALRFVGPFLSYKFGMGPSPVLAGYKITHRCNLTCAHCPYWRRTGNEQDLDGVIATLEALRRIGIRILIIEGGEPLLWRDGLRRTIADAVKEARARFPSVCLTTNGTLPWDYLPVDRAWVSLDGPREIHDKMRGDGVFDRVLANIDRCGGGRTFVSTTVNRVNVRSIPELLSVLKGEFKESRSSFITRTTASPTLFTWVQPIEYHSWMNLSVSRIWGFLWQIPSAVLSK